MKGFSKISKKLAAMALSACLIASPISSSLATVTEGNIETVSAADSSSRIRKSSRTINGVKYSFTLDLEAEDGSLSDNQISTIIDLFYEVYPQLYDRFGAYSNAQTDVKMVFETKYTHGGVGEIIKGIIYIDGKYFTDGNVHYDLLTHELGHIAQNVWNTRQMEPGALENFAEYCRYVYAYQDGKYNDPGWALTNSYEDRVNGRAKSTRFLVWLDYETNSSNKDFMRDYYEFCSDEKYTGAEWPTKVWPVLLKNTKFEGMSIDKVWKIYIDSDFSHYDSKSKNGNPSEIIRETTKEKGISIRELLKKHSFSQSYEDSLKKQK